MNTFRIQEKCFKRDSVLDWEPMQVLTGGGDVFPGPCELGLWQLSFQQI